MQLKFRAKTPSAVIVCILQMLKTFLLAQRKHKGLWAHPQQSSARAEEASIGHWGGQVKASFL